MKYIDYDNKYDEDIKDLIVELQEYIVKLDEDNLNILTDRYREEAFKKSMEEVNDNGKMILAIDDVKCIGFIMGNIVKYEDFDYIEYKCPKKGEILELIVTSKINSKGIGSELMSLMEEYFKDLGCTHISLDVFAYNNHAIDFYKRKGFHDRLVSMMKEI